MQKEKDLEENNASLELNSFALFFAPFEMREKNE